MSTLYLKIRITTLAIFWTGLAFGQSFEGTLTYTSDFEVSEKWIKMGMTKEILVSKMKKDGSYFDTIQTSYKQANYYTTPNNHPKSWSIYRADSNKIYTLQEGDAADLCIVTDASIDLEFTMKGQMPSVYKLDTIVGLDGASCNIVRVKWRTGTYDYYYDPTRLKVDAPLFTKHIYDGWAEFLKISNALPVKVIKSMGGTMTSTMTLVSVKAQVINEELFSIPKLVPDKDLNLINLPNQEVMRIAK